MMMHTNDVIELLWWAAGIALILAIGAYHTDNEEN